MQYSILIFFPPLVICNIWSGWLLVEVVLLQCPFRLIWIQLLLLSASPRSYPDFFGDTDSLSSFSQFPYNNATLRQYLSEFALQNIENWASDSKSPEAPRKKLLCGVRYNSQQNHLRTKKIKVHLLKKMFLEVILVGFFFDFSIFRSIWKPKNWFTLKKSANLLL